MNKKTERSILFCTLLIMILSCTSCINTRKATYFNDLKDTLVRSNTPIPESVIQQNDLLSISVSSLNEAATAIFNTPNAPNTNTSRSTENTTQLYGYLVSADGTIQFPLLGSIKAAGLTKGQLRDTITQSLTEKKLLVDPIITIRFLNFRVTVLGEVGHPATINVPNEKISLLEAIGMAGDLTIYAKRDNVLLIRDENGQKIIKRLDLNSNELFTSPYYYLKSSDIIYAEPNKAKVATAGRTQQWLPAVLSGLSFITIIVDRLIIK